MTTSQTNAATNTAEPTPPGGMRGLLREASDWSALRKTPYGLAPALILSLSGFFLTLSGTVFGLAGPDIVRELDISLSTIFSYGAFIGGLSIFTTLGVAYYADRAPRVRIFGWGLVAAGGVNAFVARADSVTSLAVPNTGSDVLVTIAGTPTSSLLADYYPTTARGKVFALLGMLSSAGSTLAPLIVGFTLAAIGWRAGYVVFSIPISLVGVYALLRLKEPVRGYFERKALGADEEIANVEGERPSFGEAWRTVWAIRTLRRIFVGVIWLQAGTGAFTLVFGFILAQEYGLSVRERGVFMFALGLATLVGTYVGGGLIDVLTRRRTSDVLIFLASMILLSGVMMFAISFAPPFWLVAAFSGVLSLGSGLLGPALGVLFVQVLPANVRTLGGAISGLTALPSLVVVTPIIIAVNTNYGLFATLKVGLPFMLIGTVIFLTTAPLFEFDMRSAMSADLAAEEARRSREAGQAKLLVCRDVDVAYDGVQVLFGVDFDVEDGQIIALLGTNGAGKSTLLRAISGTQEASSGAIVFDGRDVTHMPPHEIAGRGVIHMPGGRGVFPGLTVHENLLLGTWMVDPSEAQQRLPEVLELFPILAERAHEPAGALSGGEQQMLSLAQAFLAKPKLLMIDELSLGLSPAVVGQLLEVVREIHARGTTIIIVEQSVNVALTIADRAIFMEKGEVKFVGETAGLLQRPDILRAIYVKGTSGAVADRVPARTRSRSRSVGGQEGAGRNLIRLDTVTKSFGGVTAIDGLSLSISEGNTLGIIGPNGSGKTTLFDLISGYQRVDSGRIDYEGVDITRLGPEERARRGIVRRFQDARLFPSLTVFETLLVALDHRLEVKNLVVTAAGTPNARSAERRVRVKAERLIELLELGSYRDKFVKELSTGLRRVVDIACVIATEPSLLLLDEPSSGIAQAESENLGPLLRRITYETGCTMVIIEHDIPLISAVSDEMLCLERGRLLIRGGVREVLDDPRVAEAYLGSAVATVQRSGVLEL